MFWIGIIVGIIVGAIIGVISVTLFAMKVTNMNFNEMSECGWCIIDAGNNRQSSMVVYHEGEILNMVDLEDK